MEAILGRRVHNDPDAAGHPPRRPFAAAIDPACGAAVHGDPQRENDDEKPADFADHD